MKSFLFIILFLASNFAHSKDLYMTVYRDFGSDEEPQVLVHYKKQAPIEIRVLRPKNMKEFIKGQIDLRRSWRVPQSEINTTNYVLKAFNQLKINFDWVRATLDADLRTEFKGIFNGGSFRSKGTSFSLGPPKLVGAPENFEILNTLYIQNDDKDDESVFDVPGFNYWSGHNEDLKTLPLALPKLAPGFYVVQILQGNLEGQVVLIVNDLFASLQLSPSQGIVRVANRSGEVVKDAKVSIRNLKGDWIQEGNTDNSGTFQFKPQGEKDLLTVVETLEQGVAIIDSEFLSTQAIYPDLYLYTDRPMYKSYDQVSFKGILRKAEKGLSSLWKDSPKKVKINIRETKTNVKIFSQEFDITNFGTFSGTVDLSSIDETIDGGLYRLEALIVAPEDEEQTHIGEFRVKDYVKPINYIEIKTNQETLTPGDVLKAKLRISRYSGGNPKGASFKAEVYRVRFSQPQWIDDEGYGESGSLRLYSWDNKKVDDVQTPERIFVRDDQDFDDKGHAEVAIPIYGARHNEKYDYKYILKITAKDADNNFAVKSKDFLSMRAENFLRASTTHVFATSEDSPKLRIRSVTPSGKAYGPVAGAITVSYENASASEQLSDTTIEFVTDENGRYDYNIPTEEVGKITMTVVLFDKKNSKSETSVTTYIADSSSRSIVNVNEVQVLARRDYFYIGEKSKALVLLPDGWGEKGSNSGKLHITLAGKDIYKSYIQNVSGNTAWIVEDVLEKYGSVLYVIVSYPSVAGWVQRTINYTIPPVEKALKIETKLASKNVLPGGMQKLEFSVKDHSGKGVEAELSLSVVDKAVLDLQPEIRPSIFDFFYPKDRINVMSFFSNEFQSYGYGEYLTSLYKANHYVSSTKSEQDQIKEKDTAFFKADIVTDKDGKAEISFRMPSNQTIWSVIIVGVDRDGRFGEGRDKFESRLPVAFDFTYPRFARGGDEIDLTVSVAKNEHTTYPMGYSVNIRKNDEAGISNAITFNGAIKNKNDQASINKARVTLSNTEFDLSHHLDVDLTLNGNDMSFNNKLILKKRSVSMPYSEEFKLGTSSDLSLEGAQSIVSINFVTGFAGAIFDSLRWLVHYPHGCIEQLLSSTLPNVAVKTILEKINKKMKIEIDSTKNPPLSLFDFFVKQSERIRNFIFKPEDSPNRVVLSAAFYESLDQGVKFAKEGFEKISKLQRPDGSFGWFDEGNVDSNMTMTIMLSLASSDVPRDLYDLNYRGAIQILNRFVEPNSSGAMALMFIKARLVELGRIHSSQSELETSIRYLLPFALKGMPFDRYMLLGAINAIRNNGSLEEIKSQLIELIKVDLQDAINNANNGTAITTGKFRFIGSLLSSVAFGARALSDSNNFPEELQITIASFIMKNFNGRNFGMTYDTSSVLINSAWLVERQLQDLGDMYIEDIKINNEDLNEITKQIKISQESITVELPLEYIAKNKKISVETTSRLDRVAKGYIAYQKIVNIDDIKKQDHGYKINRKFYKINESNNSTRLLDENKLVFKKGDLVFVEMEIERTKASGPEYSGYIYSKLYMPGGFMAIQEDATFESVTKLSVGRNNYAKRVFNASDVVWYTDVKTPGVSGDGQRFKVGLFMRATFGGKYTGGFIELKDFYVPNTFANTMSSSFTIN